MVRDTITTIASAKSIVLYVAAGVTIDKTGLSWGLLSKRLLTDNPELHRHGLIRKDDAEALTEQLSPLENASIAYHYYEQLHSSQEDAKASLQTKLQGLLYPGSEWESGLLIKNLVRLAVALAEHDKKVTITTTNYDTHIEREYEQQAAAGNFPALKVCVLNKFHHETSGTSGAAGTITLKYLHGRIPPNEDCAGQVAVTT